MTAMMIATRRGNKEILSRLMERGGNMDLQDEVRLCYALPPYPISSNYYIIFTRMMRQL